MEQREKICLALSRGRILEQALELLAAAGIQPQDNPLRSRRLLFGTNQEDLSLFVLRSFDVPVYVRHGIAQLGVVGRDVLLEKGSEGLYELLDLGLARCRLMTLNLEGSSEPGGRLRVASKYPQVARGFYASRGRQIDVIPLYGAVEAALLSGLADQVVDIVDTGATARANRLEPLEEIAASSARLIGNRAAVKLCHKRIGELVEALALSVRAHAKQEASAPDARAKTPHGGAKTPAGGAKAPRAKA